MPVTIPDEDPTDASHDGVILHVPPAEVSVSVMVDPIQTAAGPPIVAGRADTVIVLVAEQLPIV